QLVPVGSGSYTKTFPEGTLPTGHVNYKPQNNLPWPDFNHSDAHPMITSNLEGKPIPTNDWWSSLVWNNQIGTQDYPYSLPMWAYPVTFQASNKGLGMARPVNPPVNDRYHMAGYGVDMVVSGIVGLNAPDARLHDFGDWTVTASWDDGQNHLLATMGHGMPFSYFEKVNGGDIFVDFVAGNEVSHDAGEEVIVFFTHGRKFAAFAPQGSVWQKNGTVYTTDLNGKNYWSIALLPEVPEETPETYPVEILEEFRQHAYAFPTNTTVEWNYNEANATVASTYSVQTELKESGNGNSDQVLQALLPHQWGRTDDAFKSYSYGSMRGELKVIDVNSFSLQSQFNGVLPSLPNLGEFSDTYSSAKLNQYLEEAMWDDLPITETYNQGKSFYKFVQVAQIAEQMGNIQVREQAITKVKNVLETWLNASTNPISEIFYYNEEWGTMLGYPDGHYQASLMNDHHFHWAYFIQAAVAVEQYFPGWANEWGGMIDLLIRDAATPNREDTMFPFLRNFDPYAGHSWANGGARDFLGNDQESSSESMHFNTALILWGELRGNKEIRDLGIYLYETELSAIEEYWWDLEERNFDPNFNYSAAGRIFGGGYQLATVWTFDIPEAYGINYLPIHGGSLYLGYNTDYVQKAYDEMLRLHGSNEPDLWNDIFWEYLSFADPEEALSRFESYPDYPVEYAETKAHTYHWLHNMKALGQVDTNVTANTPLAAVFNNNGNKTYVAHNYGNSDKEVRFSDGFILQVPAGKTATSRDSQIQVAITSPIYGQEYPESPINIQIEVEASAEGGISKVEFFRNDLKIGESLSAPFFHEDANVDDGIYTYVAKAFSGEESNSSAPILVTVGQGAPQEPYNGVTQLIPGQIQIAHFDEGGEGVAYHSTTARAGEADGIREDTRVSVQGSQEGNTIGWINDGEWLEYTINVQEAGIYQMDVRVATPNSQAGPFQLIANGEIKTNPIFVNSTGDWGNWVTLSVADIALNAGEQILRFDIVGGGFNLGNLTFTKTADLPGDQPPSIPQGLNTQNLTANSLTFNWEASSSNGNELSYEVNINNDLYTGTTATSVNIEGLQANTTYQLKVRAENEFGFSDFNSLEVTTPTGGNPGNLAIPENFLASNITSSSLILNWTHPSLEVNFEVFKEDEFLQTISSSSFEVDGLTPNTIYTFKVRAVDGFDQRSDFAILTVQTAPVSGGEVCSGEGANTSGNGPDYFYELSSGDNPTLTFKPARQGVG
ncbi:glycosyl hydrolase, partial [Xanthovirga aplysinae]|uniref:glycosyl hydrolase n=1 Tax=Xanthovirga aplysinae TaxID=2529853 RepID=UPI0012BD0474